MDAKFAALSSKRSSDRPAVVRKNASLAPIQKRTLLINQRTSIIPSDTQKRNALVVAIFSTWILSITNEQHFLVWVEIRVLDPADFLLPHRRCYSKSDDASHWYLLTGIRVEASQKAIKFALCRTAIAFVSLSNKAEPTEGNTSEVSWLDSDDHTVDGSGMCQDRFHIAETHPQSDGTGTFGCALLPKLDQSLAIEFRQTQGSQTAFKERQACRFRPTYLLTDLAEIIAMKSNEITKGLRFVSAPRENGFAAIDAALDFERPFFSIFRRRKLSLTYFPLRRTCTRHEPDGSLVNVAISCALRVH